MSQPNKLQKGGIVKRLPEIKPLCILNDPVTIRILKEIFKRGKGK